MSEIFKFTGKYYYVGLYKNFCTLSSEENLDDFISVKQIRSKEHPIWEFDKSITDDENIFVENYANKIASVAQNRLTIVVTKKDNKITIKQFLYRRNREVGKPYFRISTMCYFLTYNFKNNALYEGYIQDYHKKRKFKKKINRILTYGDPISNFKTKLSNSLTLSYVDQESVLRRHEIVDEVINSFINSIPDIEKYKIPGFRYDYDVFYKMFLDKNGVKLPNNWLSLIFDNKQPKKIDYKKNDFKYVDSFMLVNNLKGRKLRKVIHLVDKLNTTNLISVYTIFGEDFILSQDELLLKSILENNDLFFYNTPIVQKIIKTKKEFDNVFEIFKLVISNKIHHQTFIDHIIFYRTLNKFEEVKWLSKTYDEFQNEHLDWTDKNTFYTHATHEITYDEKLVNGLDKPIVLDKEVYYPVLLTNSKEYNRESAVQSNCVKGYVERPTSLVISLRKDNKESQDRATIEYRILFINETFKFNRVQTLGRFNKQLPQEWNEPIRELDDMLNNITKHNKLKPQTIVTKKGNKEFKRELIIQKNETSTIIRWDNNIENSEDSIYYLV